MSVLIDEKSLPTHVGYIVDGNRRWARQQGVPAYEGHLAGTAALKEVVFKTFESGVRYVSIYAFSTENWKREEGEVDRLMKLTLKAFKVEKKEIIKRRIRVKALGVTDGLRPELIEAAREMENATAQFTERTLCVCFNYGGQREIVDAARACVQDGLRPEEITEESFATRLYAPEVPAIDLIVRTSGELRLSNFMLWRAAYSEFIFLEKYWPSMHEADVDAILEEYATRKRRLGS